MAIPKQHAGLVRPAIYTAEQVRTHDAPDDLWMVVYNKVYDVTSFAMEHPGGVEVLLDCGGVDATEAFEDVAHSDDAVNMLTPYYVGELAIKDARKFVRLRTPAALIVLEPKIVEEITLVQSVAKKITSSGLSRRKARKKKQFIERLTIIFLCSLAMVAFMVYVGLQKLKWTNHLYSS